MNFFNKKTQVLIVRVLGILLPLAMVVGLLAYMF